LWVRVSDGDKLARTIVFEESDRTVENELPTAVGYCCCIVWGAGCVGGRIGGISRERLTGSASNRCFVLERIVEIGLDDLSVLQSL